MRFEMRTLKRTISALAIVLMLLLGASADVWAQGKGRHKQNQGRHLGWERGRRLGHARRVNTRGWRERQARLERRDLRRQRRSTYLDSRHDTNRRWRAERRDLRARQRLERAQARRNRGF